MKKMIGHIQVITGPMFACKTTELLRRIKVYTNSGIETKLFKPKIDVRYARTQVVTHDGIAMEAEQINHITEILEHPRYKKYKVIGIDEGQFLTTDEKDLMNVCNQMANDGKIVIISGLDMTYEGKPFVNMAFLMAIAERVDKFTANCTICKSEAFYSKRIIESENLVLLGEKGTYEARCRQHFYD